MLAFNACRRLNGVLFAIVLFISNSVFAASQAAMTSNDPANAAAGPLPETNADLLTNFSQCIETLKQKARSEHISETVVSRDLASVSFVKRVIELDRKQPEFSQTFYSYYSQRVTKARVQLGQQLMKTHAQLLSRLEHQYGVPPQYLIAFWGMETNFGRYLGKMKVLDSLATLACDPRRSEFFTNELFEALRLIDAGTTTAEQMRGSWAGAMGNMQFMPSAYRSYALDADNDGNTDLWGSLPDAFTSAANYLHQLQWKPGWRWGREVVVPSGFDYSLAGRKQVKTIKEWSSMGIKNTSGNPLPDREENAALLVPSGHKGPVFLVYDNFHVIMKWNLSEFYALSVGLLADQIKTGKGLRVYPPTQDPLPVENIKKLQMQLNSLGFDAGTVDGVFGSKTKSALRAFQKANQLIADGFPSEQSLNSVFNASKKRPRDN
ncbi:MAG: lytic murein transglycosylase [Pseudomonadales bacterium]|nr:lytic murein transglycosylase [Pseudomonadales bacterium]